jgi:hypothetical protein
VNPCVWYHILPLTVCGPGYVDGEAWCGDVDNSRIMPRCLCHAGVDGLREVTAVVFRLQTYSRLRIVERFCSVCGCGSFDGAEKLLLRKASVRSRVWHRIPRLGLQPGVNIDLCFHWDLMYYAFHSIGFSGLNVLTSWKSCVDCYRRMGLDLVAASMLSGLYKHFLEGFMDFVDLLHLPFASRLQCRCNPKYTNLVADGVTISCQRDRLDVVSAIEPDPANELIQFGSKHQERVVVSNKRVREQLYALVHGGLTPQDCNSLREECNNVNLKVLLREGCSAVTVSPGNGRVQCEKWARDLLHEVSSATPACAIVQQQQIHVLDAWVTELRTAYQGSRHPQLGQMRASGRESLPVLYSALNKIVHLLSSSLQHAGAGVRARQKELGLALLGLLDDILKVLTLATCATPAHSNPSV